MSRIDAVLIDLDNTLHDYNRAAAIARAELSGAIAKETGLPAGDILSAYQRAISETSGIAASGAEARRRRFARLSDILQKNLPIDRLVAILDNALMENIAPFPGALDALHAMSGKYRVIIMTEGYGDIQRAVAAKFGIERYPLFASYDCGKRKADGSAYAAALEHFALKPQTTAMIGDNWDWDVMAAAARGLAQIWISHGQGARDTEPARFLGAAAEFSDAGKLLDAAPSAFEILRSRPWAQPRPAQYPPAYLKALEATEPEPEIATRIDALNAAILTIVEECARAFAPLRVMNAGSTTRGTYLGKRVDFDPVVETAVAASELDPHAVTQACETMARRIENHPAFSAYLKEAGFAPSRLALASAGIRGKQSFVVRYEIADGALPHNMLDITFGRLPQLTGYEIWFQRFLRGLGADARMQLRQEIRLAKKIIRAVPGLYGSAQGGFRAHLIEQWIIQSANYRAGGRSLDNALRLLAAEAAKIENGKIASRRSFADYKTIFPAWHPGWWEPETGLRADGPGVNLFDLLGNGDAALAEQKLWPHFAALGPAHVALMEKGMWNPDALITAVKT